MQLITKWYGIHKLQETIAGLQLELARLSSDPGDLKPGRNLVRRVELKMADVMAALQWFEYHNKLDVDCDRLDHDFELFDANHLKPVPHINGQTHMHGIVTTADLVLTLSDGSPDTQMSRDVQLDSASASNIAARLKSAEISHGSR